MGLYYRVTAQHRPIQSSYSPLCHPVLTLPLLLLLTLLGPCPALLLPAPAGLLRAHQLLLALEGALMAAKQEASSHTAAVEALKHERQQLLGRLEELRQGWEEAE